MPYSFYSEESQDGFDYMFYTSTGRIYTVSFDPTLYASKAEECPTLLTHGYGLLFYFNQARQKEKKELMIDPIVCETIQAIVENF